jgi:hypothetical protein
MVYYCSVYHKMVDSGWHWPPTNLDWLLYYEFSAALPRPEGPPTQLFSTLFLRA